jgi:hypothetical protein
MSGDPRTDPEAKHLLSADPGVVQDLAAAWRGIALTSQLTSQGLHSAAGQATWTGTAADSFRHTLGTFPVALGKVTSSYQEAADGLDTYGGELSTLQPAFKSVVSQLNNADTTLAGAQTSAQNAAGALATANAKGLSNPLDAPPLFSGVPSSSPLWGTYDKANAAVQNAQSEIASLSNAGNRLLEEFKTARSAAQGKVSSASHVPPQPSSPSTLSQIADFIPKLIAGMASSLYHDVTGSLKALENVINDPSLANIGKLATDISVDAAIVALAIAAPEAAGLVDAAEAEGGAEGQALLARLLKKYLTPEQIAKEAALANAGTEAARGNVLGGAIDAGAAELPGLGKLSGLDKEAETAAANSAALNKYTALVNAGEKPVDALQTLTTEEQKYVLQNTNFMDPATNAPAAAGAQQRAAQLGAAKTGAGLADHGLDPYKDKGRSGLKSAVGVPAS